MSIARSTTKGASWAAPAAVVALVLLAVIVPAYCVVQAWAASDWYGNSSESQLRAQHGWFVGAAVSAGAAIVVALAAAIAGRVAPRVLAFLTIPVALFVLFVMSSAASQAADRLPHDETASEPQIPTCGPDSRPPVYGGDSRYTPCSDDLALVRSLVPTITAALPVEGVTSASVDATAVRLDAEGITGYEGAVAVDGEVVVATWMAAPVTCVVAVWSDDLWRLSVDGMFVDGGCGLPGSNPESAPDQRGGGER